MNWFKVVLGCGHGQLKYGNKIRIRAVNQYCLECETDRRIAYFRLATDNEISQITNSISRHPAGNKLQTN